MLCIGQTDKEYNVKKSTFGLSIALALTAACQASAVQVRQVFRAERLDRGDTNVRRVQPIDEAAWVWMPGHDRWGVAADFESWNVRFGIKTYPVDFFHFRRTFASDGSALRFDVSADERFVLYLDGRQIAQGPQRGLVDHWFYQSYEVTDLPAGPHTLEAVCWQLGLHAPLAQLSFRGGFILKAEGAYDAELSTGKAAWEVARLTNTEMTNRGTSKTFGVGSQCRQTGTGFVNERPAESEWRKAGVVRDGVRVNPHGAHTKGWMLFPADRPDQTYALKTPGRVVNVSQDLTKPFTVPADTTLDLWWDLDDYYCAYPELETAGGKGAVVEWGWTESLQDAKTPGYGGRGAKGNRDEWKGKAFLQTLADTFVCDGRADAFFTAPWWRCGRWCRVTVKTAGEPLTVRRLALAESRYPLAVDGAFACDDPSMDAITRICRRTMASCMHEMLFDCPYYEQQMYPGDTRIQLQVLNALTRDARMTRFAISAFEWDRRHDGMVPMNFPTRGTQESATYTLCWLMMFGDYARWHDDADFLRHRLPGARASLMGLSLYENAEGLIANLPGWSFLDWVQGKDGFPHGVAPDGESPRPSALNNLQYLLALQSVAYADEAIGEKNFARQWREKADRLARAILATYWDASRGLLADTVAKDRFSEHGQAMAIIAGILTPERRASALAALERRDSALAPASSYYAYYLFDAFAACGRADLIRARLDMWRQFLAWGARTAFETQHCESRSDCHAWCACPLYFQQSAFAGVRPDSPFFRTVRVAPQPAGFRQVRAKTPCPKGVVETDLNFEGKGVSGAVTLPAGLTGVFEWQGRTLPLKAGKNAVAL